MAKVTREQIVVLMDDVCARTRENPPDLAGELDRLRDGSDHIGLSDDPADSKPQGQL